MLALLLDRPGGPETLHLENAPVPQPGAGEIRVAVHAVGLNPVDYKFAATGHPAWRFPFILGLDVAGTVDAVGPEVATWKPGDRVYYHGDLARPGGYAEYTVVTAQTVAEIPDNVSFVEAAALPCAGFTAYQALFRKLHIQRGQTLLVQGAAGGVGGFAVQLAASVGVQVLGTCSAGNADWVRQLGAAETLDYRRSDLADQVKQLTAGRGPDAVFDAVGPETAAAGLEMLAFGGGLACAAGVPDLARLRWTGRALSIHAIALGGVYRSGDAVALAELAAFGRELAVRVSARALDPMVQRTLRLADVPQALAQLAQRHVRGKIVAQVRD